MQKSNYEVEVLVNGKPLKEYMHEGKVHVEGRKGTSFSLRLRNNSSERKLFVPSIDGLSVMNGEEASHNSSGYIIRPWSSITIDGWRVSDEQVAEFYFSAPNESYRKQMERGNNLGVIGVLVFSEKQKLQPIVVEKIIHDHCHHSNWCWLCQRYHCPCQKCWSRYNWVPCDYNSIGSMTFTTNVSNQVMSLAADNTVASSTSSQLSMRSTQEMSQDLGTGWGDYRRSEVTTVEFEREDYPTATFEIYYNTREQLERLGVNFKRESLYATPSAFPGQYCKPPQSQ